MNRRNEKLHYLVDIIMLFYFGTKTKKKMYFNFIFDKNEKSLEIIVVNRTDKSKNKKINCYFT